jgi:hypothetical protein
MEQIFEKYLDIFFRKLIEEYQFSFKSRIKDGQAYLIEYCSNNLVIKIEKYFREFYVTLCKENDDSNCINLFNLLEFLTRDLQYTPKSKYFHEIQDLEMCYKEQLNYISKVIYDNYTLINDFYTTGYESRLSEFDKYWQDKHPELYRTI